MWRRFRQEMEDLELLFKGPYVLAEAPAVRDAHDDFADSLAMACVLTKDEENAQPRRGGAQPVLQPASPTSGPVACIMVGIASKEQR